MAIYDYLPTYHVVEPNNLKGLQAGLVVAQMEVKEDCKYLKQDLNKKKVLLENGHLCAISKDGIKEWAAEDAVMFLHYTEPLNTILNSDKYFAVNTSEELPRLVQLMPGDEWMSDIDYFKDSLYTDVAEELKKHIIQYNSSESNFSKDDWYAVDSLADGTKAFHYIYLG